jgi:hypothetical protein
VLELRFFSESVCGYLRPPGALFPLAGEEKKSKIETQHHRPHSLAPAARARQLQQDLKLQPPISNRD